MTRPWTPYPPVWEWDGIKAALGERCREHFEYRSAILEYDGGQVRGVAEMRAYCAIIEVLHEKHAFTTEQIQKYDVIEQISGAESFRRHDAIGRCIMNGTWPAKYSGVTKEERELLIAAQMQ